MLTLIITVGPPGSGKSSYIDAVQPDQVFCPDNQLIVNNKYTWSPKDSERAWQQEYRRFGHALSVVTPSDTQLWAWDATFPSRIGRSAILGIAKGYGAKVVAACFNTPLDVCLGRNAQRSDDRRIPESKIRETNERLEVPQLEEGFDAVLNILPGDYAAIALARKWKHQ
jgi:predicted kinase